MTLTTSDLTIRKTITVPLRVDEAFALYTERVATWWPVATHSMHDGEPVYEPHAGGELYERTEDGTRAHWATIREWDPPNRLALGWRVNPTSPETDIVVRFTPDGDGTRVELEHSGWERYGDGARESFEDYDGGWDVVLGRFVEVAGA